MCFVIKCVCLYAHVGGILMKKYRKSEDGITLVTIVIMIVIITIIASVSIINGVSSVEKAKEQVKENNLSAVKAAVSREAARAGTAGTLTPNNAIFPGRENATIEGKTIGNGWYLLDEDSLNEMGIEYVDETYVVNYKLNAVIALSETDDLVAEIAAKSAGSLEENIDISDGGYVVSLNANGGTGGSDSVTVALDSNMPSAVMPIREGYTFAGYYDATSGGTQYYTASGTSARTWDKSADATLYAIWTINDYAVTLNKNNGTGGSNSVTVTYNGSMPDITVPTRTGYTFNGYYDATAGGTLYYNTSGRSAHVWNKAYAGTLYARWTANTYTVTLNQNSGIGGTASVTATYNSNMPNAIMPTRTGYTFAGYYDASSGGTLYYNASGVGSNIWNKASAGTLIARWNANTITLNLDNQSANTAGTGTVYYKYNTATYYSNSACTTQMTAITVPARTGYTFGGYYTAANGGGTQYINASGAFVNNLHSAITENRTLYAKWTANTITLSLNNQSATTAGSTAVYFKYTTPTYYSNSACTAQITAITVPTRAGYTFGGYFTATDGNGVQYINASGGFINNPQTAFSGNATLYAKWTANTIKLTLNNQTATTAGTTEVYYKYATALYYLNSACTTRISTITVPTRIGYTFGGYYSAANGGGTQYINASGAFVNNPHTVYSANTTLYAKWTANTITLTLNNQSATSAGTTAVYYKYATATYYSNSACTTQISAISVPSRTGYTFGGYYTGTGGGGTQYINASGAFVNNPHTTFSSNVVLYAKWTANTITLTLNNQSATSAGTTAVYYKYGTAIYYSNSACTTQLATITIPTRTGYTFAGYFTATNGGGTQYIDERGTYMNNPHIMVSSNTTLYAKWRANP